jgi:hypothetical protein
MPIANRHPLGEKRAFRRSAAQCVSMRHELLIIGELGATAPIQDHYKFLKQRWSMMRASDQEGGTDAASI